MPLLGLGVNLDLTAGTASTPSASSGTPTTPTTPTTPSGPVSSGTSISRWAITAGETIYVNTRASSLGLTAWVAYQVIYVFADGNAVLVREPGFVAYTGDLAVGVNLRRKAELYSDSYPGP